MADHELTPEEAAFWTRYSALKKTLLGPPRARVDSIANMSSNLPDGGRPRFAEIKSETVLPRSELDVFWGGLEGGEL